MISFLIEEHEGIRKFFEGSDEYLPIAEYRYLHDRPLLRPNFLTQVDDLASILHDKIAKNNLRSGVPVEKLVGYVVTIGQNLEGDLTDQKIEIILRSLREIYKICTELNKKLK